MPLSIPKAFISSPSEDGEPITPEVGDVVPVDACVRIIKADGDNFIVEVCGISGNDVGEYGEKEESEDESLESLMAKAKAADEED